MYHCKCTNHTAFLQLTSDRVVVLDDRCKHIYLWRGKMTSFSQRKNGLEGATCLKGDHPRGAKLIQVCAYAYVHVTVILVEYYEWQCQY
jgi:hypothetical protein